MYAAVRSVATLRHRGTRRGRAAREGARIPSMAAQAQPPYWHLISVLFSSLPLTPALAMTLHQAAYDLYQRGAGTTPVAGDMLQGRVTNLRKDMLLGTIAGPAFEARIETERGKGTVRFLLTRQGLELMEARPGPPAPKKPRYLN